MIANHRIIYGSLGNKKIRDAQRIYHTWTFIGVEASGINRNTLK